MVVTRIPEPSHSIASEAARLSSPAFVAVYAAILGRGLPAASDVMKTRSPRSPRARSEAIATRDVKRGPSRLVATSRCSASTESSCSQPGVAMPALLTKTSTGPMASSVAAKNASTDPGSVTSIACANASPPASRTLAAVSSRRSTRRAPMATAHPRRPSSTAMAGPMPDDAPVTSAVLRSPTCRPPRFVGG